jgi:hypothetical protein
LTTKGPATPTSGFSKVGGAQFATVDFSGLVTLQVGARASSFVVTNSLNNANNETGTLWLFSPPTY